LKRLNYDDNLWNGWQIQEKKEWNETFTRFQAADTEQKVRK